jgi:hypothetical protein
MLVSHYQGQPSALLFDEKGVTAIYRDKRKALAGSTSAAD